MVKQLMDAVQSSIQVLRFIITCVFSNSLSNLLDLREKKTISCTVLHLTKEGDSWAG